MTLIFGDDRPKAAARHLLDNTALRGTVLWQIGEYDELHVDDIPGYASTGEKLLYDVLASFAGSHPVDLSWCAVKLDRRNAGAVHEAVGLLLLGATEVGQ